MARRRSRKRDNSRRRYLKWFGVAGAVLFGAVAATRQSGAFSSIVGDRISAMDIAPEGEGVIGLEPQDTVQFKQRDPLIQITNNHTETVTITVSLHDKDSDGTLYDNEGEEGATVSFNLPVGDSHIVDIRADITGNIPYDIDVSSPSLSFSAIRSTESTAGLNHGAVAIFKPNSDADFTSNLTLDQWEVSQIDVRDDDGDDDLSHIDLRVREGGATGDTVATATIDIPATSSGRYAPAGQLDAIIKPDDLAYSLKSNTLYNLAFLAYDADDNFAAESLDDET